MYPTAITATRTSEPDLAVEPAYSERPKYATAANMEDRIDQLESLVLTLMRQTAPKSESYASPLDQAISPQSNTLLTTPHRYTRLEPLSSGLKFEQTLGSPLPETHGDVSPSPSDHGSMRIQQSGVSYVGSSHWAGVLDSIADLRSHLAQLRFVDSSQPLTNGPKPYLLYSSPMYATTASIIEAIPPRPVADRLVSRYFHVLDIAPGNTP